MDEVIGVLADQAPDVHEALERAKAEGMAYVILDGKIFSADRCAAKTISVKGTQIDLWYSGKAHEHGGNVQALSAPGGFPLWVADVESSSVHDLTVARDLYWAASHLDLPTTTLADGATPAAGSACTLRSGNPPETRYSTWTIVPITPCSAAYVAWANAASPSRPAAGARCTTSPPAPARSAALLRPRSHSRTVDSPESR